MANSHEERHTNGDRHALCTCPVTNSGPFGWPRIEPRPDCPGGSIAHPVLDAATMRAILAEYDGTQP